TTRYLHMVLDHDSGAMRGDVLRGTYQGRILGSLDVAELISLLQECRKDDGQSAQVLETYLNREYPDWHDQDTSQTSSGNTSSGEMSRTEALQILGVDENASQDDIREAHRHLIASMHPDKGGSTYLAAKINQAKDLLING
ncbi:MAG: DnaJ domain-containing protein, partial [Rhodospirillales bacterium]|nr:DnaJ domain-containing protein [Rhodospirillales bacterium]